MRNVLLQTLPLDEERRVETGVWITFLVKADVDPDLATFMRQAWARIHDFIDGQIRSAQENCEAPADLDPDREMVTLLSLADGLVSHLLIGHCTNEKALTAVDEYLDRLFG